MPDRTDFWHNNPAANTCQCQEELQWVASRLAGQCILENGDPKAIVDIILTKCGDDRWSVCFGVRNRLTPATALGFLHFMRHLSHVQIILTDMEWSPTFNWDLVQPGGFVTGSRLTHQFPRLHCHRLWIDEYFCTQLIPRIGRFFQRCHELWLGIEAIPTLLKLVTNSPNQDGVVKKLNFGYGYFNFEDIDFVVQYFQQEPVNLELCVPSFSFHPLENIKEWPVTCFPREAGQTVPCNRMRRLDEEEECETREYSFINEPSGKKFRVWLTCSSPKRKRIVEFHLLL